VAHWKTLGRRGVAPVARWLVDAGVTPNMLTVAGFLLNLAVAGVLAAGHPTLAGALFLVVNVLDVLDGAVARLGGRASAFGAFLDSTLDRYAEAAVYLGLVVWAMPRGETGLVVLSYLALVGSLMVSYTRARAEGLGYHGEVGLLQRPERVILLGLALILHPWALTPALVAIAALTTVTTAQRVLHVWKQARPASDP